MWYDSPGLTSSLGGIFLDHLQFGKEGSPPSYRMVPVDAGKGKGDPA